MASAPTPGASRPESDGVLILTLDGVAVRLDIDSLGAPDAARFRKADVGMTLMAAIDTLVSTKALDIDVFCALWWLGHARDGGQMTFQQALAGFPGYADLDKRFSVTHSEPEEDGSPEASGGPSELDGPRSPEPTDSTPGTSADPTP